MAGISSPLPLTSPAEADPVLIATRAMDPRETANHLVIFTSCSIRRSGHFPGIPSNVGPNRETVNCPLSLRLQEIHQARRCRTACARLSLLARAPGTAPFPTPHPDAVPGRGWPSRACSLVRRQPRRRAEHTGWRPRGRRAGSRSKPRGTTPTTSPRHRWSRPRGEDTPGGPRTVSRM